MENQDNSELSAQIKQLIKKKKYHQAEMIVKDNIEMIPLYVSQMSTNVHAKRASEFLPKVGLRIVDYPELVDRLNKKATRYQISNFCWERVEEKLRSNISLLTIAAEDYFFKGQLDVAYSIIKRNNLRSIVEKTETKAWLSSIENKDIEEPMVICNRIIEQDVFGNY